MVSSLEVATLEELPASFLAKIFQKLARHGILQSSRGSGHGYALAVAPEAISLMGIIEAVQGPNFMEQCVFWSGRCGGVNPCLLHERWLTVKPQIGALLEGTSLADLAERCAAPGVGGTRGSADSARSEAEVA